MQVQGSLPPTVNVPNAPPIVSLGNGANVTLSSTFSRSGSFVSAGSTFTASVNYGDGSGTQSLLLTAKTFSLSHVYASAGDFTATVSTGDPRHLREVERRHVQDVLKQENYNKVHAAKELGVSRRTLYRLITKYGLEKGPTA